MAPVLLLALLVAGSAGASSSSPEARPELVRAVEVEAEDADTLRALVDLQPGQPLDREAIGRGVERMFATGRFEDVTVHLARAEDGGGVSVIFRPLPAPLLVSVRVEGDRVLSPSSLAKIARLRVGEALWPSRLERAARDVGLALARQGYVEAYATPNAARVPGGADGVFRIHAGPRVRVGQLLVVSAEAVPGPSLDYLARPRRGDIYSEDVVDTSAQEIRRRLVRAGRWRASVTPRPTYDPGRGVMDLVFEVVPGPRMAVEVRGAPLPHALLVRVQDLVRDGRASSDALEAGGEQIESQLRQQGYRDATVRPSTEPRGKDESVVYEVQPGPRALTASVKLQGADAALLEGLRTRPGRPLEDAGLDEDVGTIRARLEALGHFEARVESEVPDGGGSIDVVFLARPGPRVVVSALEIRGPRLPVSRDDTSPEALPIRAGLPYRLADVARSRDALTAAWRRAGYLDARVRAETQFSEQRDAVRLVLVVEPGPRTLVDHVVLAGLSHTQAAAVDREMVLRPGEPFSFERLLESQRRLSSLGIFERVSISELEPVHERRDVVVSVQEAPSTTVSWGLGYFEQDSTARPLEQVLEGLRGSVELTRRNLGGMGRTASVFARGSFRGSRLLTSLREPWLFGRRFESIATAYWEEETRSGFSYNRKGVTLQAGRTLDSRTSLILRYLLQDTHLFRTEVPIDTIDRQYRTYTVSGPSASVLFDTRDDPLEPKRGVFLGADLQLSLAELGGKSFLKGYFQATSVRPLGADLVLVLSGRLGLAGGLAQDAGLLPQPERFYAGGDFGPRGFRVDAVGPQGIGSDGLPYPLGGNALLLGGAEMRYNVTHAFQLASFLDLGNVYPDAQEIDLSDLRRSAGVGLRYRTPVGPVRLDWGYVLDRRSGEPRSKLHFTIGHAF